MQLRSALYAAKSQLAQPAQPGSSAANCSLTSFATRSNIEPHSIHADLIGLAVSKCIASQNSRQCPATYYRVDMLQL